MSRKYEILPWWFKYHPEDEGKRLDSLLQESEKAYQFGNKETLESFWLPKKAIKVVEEKDPQKHFEKPDCPYCHMALKFNHDTTEFDCTKCRVSVSVREWG